MKKILKTLAIIFFGVMSLFVVLDNLDFSSTLATQELEKKTIEDFGDQWGVFAKNTGYYASSEIFQDILGPHFKASSLKDKVVIDIGSGSGRIVSMIYKEKPAHIHAVEPALIAFKTLKENTDSFKNLITYHNETGENFVVQDADYVISLGVIHHIPAPLPTIKNIYKSLKKEGKFVMWLYAHEGNELYLKIFQPIRKVTTRLNDSVLHVLSQVLTFFLSGYIIACDYLPLPMQDYMLNHLKHFSWHNRFLTVFDQLNPAWAKYYTKEEAVGLMQAAGFHDISAYYRHGYSWTIIGTK